MTIDELHNKLRQVRQLEKALDDARQDEKPTAQLKKKEAVLLRELVDIIPLLPPAEALIILNDTSLAPCALHGKLFARAYDGKTDAQKSLDISDRMRKTSAMLDMAMEAVKLGQDAPLQQINDTLKIAIKALVSSEGMTTGATEEEDRLEAAMEEAL